MKSLGMAAMQALQSIPYSESPIETKLFHALLRNPPFVLCGPDADPTGEGYFIFPQHQIGQYRADFIIKANGYLPAQRVWPPRLSTTIAIECDGHEFHSTEEQKIYDKTRDQYFLSQNIKTIRFSGAQIHANVNFCVDQIAHALDMGMKS